MVFRTLVPRNVRLAEAPSHGLPGVIFDPTSRGAVAFIEFAKELVKRVSSDPLFMPRAKTKRTTESASKKAPAKAAPQQA